MAESNKNIIFNTSTCDPLVGRLITWKWGPGINKIFKQQLMDPREVLSVDYILKFLTRIFHALKAVDTAKAIKCTIPSLASNSCKSWNRNIHSEIVKNLESSPCLK